MSISQHIASIRSRASHQQHRASEGEQADGPSHNDGTNSETLSKLSVISLSDDEGLKYISGSSSTRRSTRDETPTAPEPPTIEFSSLSVIDNIQDIEINLEDEELRQTHVLNKLERKWLELSKNLDATLAHLQHCSYQVTESSTACLGALKDSVETTCDKIDTELKAFYDLMTKCDELTTKLSMATTFREEIRTLRKTVETLEQLNKNKPQLARRAINHPAQSSTSLSSSSSLRQA